MVAGAFEPFEPPPLQYSRDLASQTEVREMSGTPWLDALKETLKEEALDAEGREAVAREDEERWDEEVAYKLIRRALAYLRERHLEAGKPDFDATALNPYTDAIDETYGAEDMDALRGAVRAFVGASLKAFRRGVKAS